MKEFLSLKEVAEYLGVEYKAIYRLIRRGQLPAAKIGGVYRIRRDDLEAFLERQKQETMAQAMGWICATCGERFFSSLSLGGRCLICDAPICQGCWLEGRRACPKHESQLNRGERGKKPPTSLLKCARCHRLIPSKEKARPCTAAGCKASLCDDCWRFSLYCPLHQPSLLAKLEEAKGRLARGEIDLLITATEARQRELAYLGRFDRKVRQIETLRHPVTGALLRFKGEEEWEECHRYADESAKVMDILGVGYLNREKVGYIPLNVCSRYEVPTERSKEMGLILEIAIFSHLEAHVREGFNTAPATVDDLLTLLEPRIREAEERKMAYAVGLAATCGWDSEALAYIAGGDRGQAPSPPFAHRLLLPYLIDLYVGTLAYNRSDERLVYLASLFSPRIFAEEVQEVMAYVEEYMRAAIPGSLAATEVVHTLEIEEPVVMEAFRRLAGDGEGRFRLYEIPGLGWVLARC